MLAVNGHDPAPRHDRMAVGPRTHKQASLRIAVAECLPDDMHADTREVVGVASANPRKGHATALLWEVCREADAACVMLVLFPSAFADGMDDAALERWYARFGFVAVQREPAVMMARSPCVRLAS